MDKSYLRRMDGQTMENSIAPFPYSVRRQEKYPPPHFFFSCKMQNPQHLFVTWLLNLFNHGICSCAELHAIFF